MLEIDESALIGLLATLLGKPEVCDVASEGGLQAAFLVARISEVIGTLTADIAPALKEAATKFPSFLTYIDALAVSFASRLFD